MPSGDVLGAADGGVTFGTADGVSDDAGAKGAVTEVGEGTGTGVARTTGRTRGLAAATGSRVTRGAVASVGTGDGAGVGDRVGVGTGVGSTTTGGSTAIGAGVDVVTGSGTWAAASTDTPKPATKRMPVNKPRLTMRRLWPQRFDRATPRAYIADY